MRPTTDGTAEEGEGRLASNAEDWRKPQRSQVIRPSTCERRVLRARVEAEIVVPAVAAVGGGRLKDVAP